MHVVNKGAQLGVCRLHCGRTLTARQILPIRLDAAANKVATSTAISWDIIIATLVVVRGPNRNNRPVQLSMSHLAVSLEVERGQFEAKCKPNGR